MESAAHQAIAIAANNRVPVQAVQCRSQFSKRKYKHARSNKPSAATTAHSQHLANSSQCPAAKATCKSCHKVGHFARVCRLSKASDVSEIQLPKMTVLYLNNPCHQAHLRVKSTSVHLLHLPAPKNMNWLLTLDLQYLFCHTTSHAIASTC